MQSLLTIVGERIRLLRKNRGLTQAQLGEIVGIPQSYMGVIERGEKNLSLETIQRISDALDVNPDEFFKAKISKEGFEKEKLIDSIILEIQNRNTNEVQLIKNLIVDVLKVLDAKR